MPRFYYHWLPQRSTNGWEKRLPSNRTHPRRQSRRNMSQSNWNLQTMRFPHFSFNFNSRQETSQTLTEIDQIPEDTFTTTMEINEVSYQLVYPQTPSSLMQLYPIIVPDFPSLHYPTHGYYQTHWTWGQFQWPLTIQMHQSTLFVWSLQNISLLHQQPSP